MEFDTHCPISDNYLMSVIALSLIFLSFSFNLHAAAVEGVNAFRNPQGNVTLTGENCDLLKRHQSALSTWKTHLQETPQKPTRECTCDSLRCYMNVDSVVPDFIQRFLDVDAGRWGPNCWNTALVASKILPVLRFSPPAEMNFWMSSPLCKAVPEDETPEPGDIVAIRDSAQNEIHAFTFITEELFFTKNYLTTRAPYRLQSAPDMYSIFPVPFDCRHRVGNPKDCQVRENYYRCISFDAFVQTHKIEFSPRYIQLEILVREQEQRVSQVAFEWKTNPPLQQSSPLILKDAQTKMIQIQTEVNLSANDTTLSADQQLLWNGLKFRIMGLLQTIDWVD